MSNGVPEALIHDLTSRKCVAFIGAGFSMPAGMPSWGGLLKALMNRALCNGAKEGVARALAPAFNDAIAAGEHLIAADIIKRCMQEPEVFAEVERQFSVDRINRVDAKSRSRMEARLECLSQLPWRGIITTNYDCLLEYGFYKYRKSSPIDTIDAGNQLGTVLNRPSGDQIFFVKIHGSIGLEHIVLSPEEYGDRYYRTPRMERFISAVLLGTTVVFLGCSLDDEIINIRRRLVAEYRGHIPLSYALLVDDAKNRHKAAWLHEGLRVHPILYEGASGHEGFDEYFNLICKMTAAATVESIGGAYTIKRLKQLNLKQKWGEVGTINQDILIWISQCGGLIRHEALIDLKRDSRTARRKTNKSLNSISFNERIYRVLFLASIGLLEERADAKGRYYIIDQGLSDGLSSFMRIQKGT